MSCRHHHEDRSDVVIPSRSVIEFYQRELGYLKDSEAEEQRQSLKRLEISFSASVSVSVSGPLVPVIK
jgi:hypothetical protein